jgi:heme-degrading monooxygenase HmoA
MICQTPAAPYYAVIFSIVRAKADEKAYIATAEKMVTLMAQQDGFLGLEVSPESPEGFSLTVCYWRDEEAIHRWKQQADHLVAQKLGKEKWYLEYSIRIAKVERAYDHKLS